MSMNSAERAPSETIFVAEELDTVAEPSPEKRKRLSVETVRNNVGLDEETAQQIHTIVAEKAMAQRSSAARSNGPRSRRRKHK